MSEFQAVRFVAAHLPEATDLWVEAWMRAMPGIDFEARRAWFVDRITDLQSEGVEVVCAFDLSDGRMAGFVTVDLGSGHVDQFAVGPHAWGRGVAPMLLNEAKRMSRGHLILDVNQDNARAVRVYEREGFRRVGAGRNSVSGLSTWRYEWRREG